MGKTFFRPVPDLKTGDHMENPSFTGPPKLYRTLYYFFNITVPIEGLPTGFFYQTGAPAQQGFSWVLYFTGRGPVDFPMSDTMMGT